VCVSACPRRCTPARIAAVADDVILFPVEDARSSFGASGWVLACVSVVLCADVQRSETSEKRLSEVYEKSGTGGTCRVGGRDSRERRHHTYWTLWRRIISLLKLWWYHGDKSV